ncbi:RDD family protein [Pelagicoccus mobilis]|uniref:RDD family protein n=1 Tax=Pelagicoccus mobilis TaxID=415221 RepID=A0A934VU55_9BACT|nr:RDD family protein [Pelagicoccus mobilis]MBK1880760.1 RDD family protein [Pelagicoccus mobilis]
MNQLKPSSYHKRVAAFVINFVIGGFLISVTNVLEINEDVKQKLPMLLGLAYVLIFTIFPESPGKRILRLRTLDLKMEPIGAKKRWIRNSVYLVYLSIMSAFYFFPPLDIKEMGVSMFWLFPTHVLIPLFLMANGFTVLMNPSGQSLIDLRTKTQTYGYEKPKGMLKAY